MKSAIAPTGPKLIADSVKDHLGKLFPSAGFSSAKPTPQLAESRTTAYFRRTSSQQVIINV
jgi:hypothetical protein